MIDCKEKNFISAVIYVNNNEDTIREMLESLHCALDEKFQKFEIVCVNDGSTDKSLSIIQETGKTLESGTVSVINMSYFQGVEHCMNAGVNLAIGDFVFEFDTSIIDYEMDLIYEVYKCSLEGFDIVAASMQKNSRNSSRLYYKIFNLNARFQYNLASESFRILSRRAINRIHSMGKTIPYRKALYANCGLNMSRVQYEAKQTSRATVPEWSNYRFEKAIDSLIIFTNIGYKISVFLTAIMLISTISVAIYTIVVYLLGLSVPGFTPMMLVISGGFFGVFGIMAIIVKYLSILLDLVYRSQNYLIESIQKL